MDTYFIYLILSFQNKIGGNSLAVQWLRLRDPNVGGIGSIPGQKTKIPHATRHSQKKKMNLEKEIRPLIRTIYKKLTQNGSQTQI